MERDAFSSPYSLTDMVIEEHISANRSTWREMKATVRSTIPTGTGALILHSHLKGRRSCTGNLWSARQLVEAGIHNVYKVPNYLPWATPFNPGSSSPSPITVPYGNYTVSGKVSGQAQVRFFGETSINRVAVHYNDYSDHKEFVLNGYEDVTISVKSPNVWGNKLNWYSDIVQTRSGVVTAIKVTCADGVHLRIDAMTSIFDANWTLTTVFGGTRYEQPANSA